MIIDLKNLEPAQRQNWLQHAVAPRPIAFASTMDIDGNINLSPFSFFNLFSANPPIVIFSPARRVRDNTIKHTLENVLQVPQVGINICDTNMVQQVSLSSCEYPKGIDEFLKSGFTKQASTHIKPPLVAEAKIKMECNVIEVKSLGENKGAGQLVIAEVITMHVADDILNEEKTSIDYNKISLIARLGGDWYCNTNNLFKVPKPNTKLGIGVDALPENIKHSKVLTGNNLGLLANVDEMPNYDTTFEDERVKNIVQYYNINPAAMEKELHIYANELLNANDVTKAWQVLLINEN